jgi:anaerobic ribonucleoside-triphosphate reductase activating protein
VSSSSPVDDVGLLELEPARDAKAEPAAELRVGGFVPLSTGDYPGELATVIFCQGCPWRCRYCHNPHLQAALPEQPLEWESVHARLSRRRGLVDAVVFSGGEPTAQPALPAAVAATRALGFRVGLHTAGIYPRSFKRLLPQLDWVGFDVKASPEGYARVTGVAGAARAARESLALLLESGVPFEARTTVHADLIGDPELIELAEDLARLGVKRYALQQFRGEGCADAALRTARAPAGPSAEARRRIAPLFEWFEIRSA